MTLHDFCREKLEAHGFADLDEAENDGLANVGHCVVQLGREGACRELEQVTQIFLRHLICLVGKARAQAFDTIFSHPQHRL